MKTDCVLWGGTKISARGYGVIYLGRRYYYMHRVFYMLYNGPIPKGHVVHHTCETPGCVNPRHLVAVSKSEHARIHNGDHCKRGHEYTAENTYVDAKAIRHCRMCYRAKGRRLYAAKRAA